MSVSTFISRLVREARRRRFVFITFISQILTQGSLFYPVVNENKEQLTKLKGKKMCIHLKYLYGEITELEERDVFSVISNLLD